AVGADENRDRIARAERPRTPSWSHHIQLPAPIELDPHWAAPASWLLSAFAQAQHRRIADVEGDVPRLIVEHQFLYFTPGGALDEDRQRRGGDCDVQRAHAGLHRPLDRAQADRWAFDFESEERRTSW